jgi:hypothetical protein
MAEAIGYVLDGSKVAPGNGLIGATVEFLSGHNAGRTAITTDTSGLFTFGPPFICGPYTIRASKPGYGETAASGTWCVDAFNLRLVLTPQ